jgi:RNA polymerase sigma-70 factor (ECF subfamily)
MTDRPRAPEGSHDASPPAPDDGLTPRVYEEIRQLAAAYMRRERAEHTLQPTALANEAYMRLSAADGIGFESKSRFLAIAARCMRQILVDHARARNASKRRGKRTQLTLSDTVVGVEAAEVDVLDLHEALVALADHDERKAQVVELRFFAGLTIKEVAELLGVSNTTAEDDWYMARAWLKQRLKTTPT